MLRTRRGTVVEIVGWAQEQPPPPAPAWVRVRARNGRTQDLDPIGLVADGGPAEIEAALRALPPLRRAAQGSPA